MGAELLISAVEIENDKEPDFNAAMRYAKGLSDEEIIALMLEEGDGEPFIDGMRATLEGTVVMMKRAWNEELRDMAVLNLSKTKIIVAGGESWGDMPEGCEEIDDFVRYGLAKIAGFIVEDDIEDIPSDVEEVTIEVTCQVASCDESIVDKKEAIESAQEAVEEALRHGENRGFNHCHADTLYVGIAAVENK